MIATSWRTPFVILVCGTLVMMIGFGVRMTFGLWLAPASTSLGWGLETLSLAMAVQSLSWGVATPIAGIIADRYGTGRVVVGAGVAYVAGLLLMAVATTPAEAMLGIGVLTGIAMGGCSTSIILTVLSRAVPDMRKRAIYTGIATAGGFSGQIVFLPATQSVLMATDWTVTLMILGAVAALIIPLAAALVSPVAERTPIDQPQTINAALGEAFRHRGYVLLSIGYFVCGFQTLFIATHFPPMLGDLGISNNTAAWALSLLGLTNLISCFSWAALGGRWRGKHLLCWIYVLRSVAMTLFVLLPITDLSVLVFASAIGLVWLGTVPLTAGVVARIFGTRYMATLFGFSFLSHQFGSFIGIWAGGWLFDETGSYMGIWWASIALGLVAAAFNLPIDDRPVTRVATAETPI